MVHVKKIQVSPELWRCRTDPLQSFFVFFQDRKAGMFIFVFVLMF